MSQRPGPAGASASIDFRRAEQADIPACASIWRIAINDYATKMGQPEIPDDLDRIVRLYGHLIGTDPERFVVAVTPDAGAPGGERVVAFAVAVQRDRVWFLSMLFVLPEWQARGMGRELLQRVLPDPGAAVVRATGTDTAQPISNGLYARFGIVPRMPLFSLTGLPRRPDALGELPGGIVAVPFDEIAGGDGTGHRDLATTVDALERDVNGFSHPVDHRYLRSETRHGWLYQGPGGEAIGYGYVSESGRLGPALARDPDLLGPILGHLCSVTQPRGAFATWIPGHADRALVPMLEAGLRLDPFPVLLCWDDPPADFERYLPISPGLL